MTNDFETALAPWEARGSGAATVELTTEAHSGSGSALVSGRDDSWNGLGAPITVVLDAGAVYDMSAWVKLPEGATGPADVRIPLSITSRSSPMPSPRSLLPTESVCWSVATGAGTSRRLVEWLAEQGHVRSRTLEYSIGFSVTEIIRGAVTELPAKAWTTALESRR